MEIRNIVKIKEKEYLTEEKYIQKTLKSKIPQIFSRLGVITLALQIANTRVVKAISEIELDSPATSGLLPVSPTPMYTPMYIRFSREISQTLIISMLIAIICYKNIKSEKENFDEQVSNNKHILAKILLALSTISTIICIILKIFEYLY